MCIMTLCRMTKKIHSQASDVLFRAMYFWLNILDPSSVITGSLKIMKLLRLLKNQIKCVP